MRIRLRFYEHGKARAGESLSTHVLAEARPEGPKSDQLPADSVQGLWPARQAIAYNEEAHATNCADVALGTASALVKRCR